MRLKNLSKIKNRGEEMRVRYTKTANDFDKFPAVISLQRGRLFEFIPTLIERHYDTYEDFDLGINKKFETNYIFPSINYFRNRTELRDAELDKEIRILRKDAKEELRKQIKCEEGKK